MAKRRKKATKKGAEQKTKKLVTPKGMTKKAYLEQLEAKYRWSRMSSIKKEILSEDDYFMGEGLTVGIDTSKHFTGMTIATKTECKMFAISTSMPLKNNRSKSVNYTKYATSDDPIKSKHYDLVSNAEQIGDTIIDIITKQVRKSLWITQEPIKINIEAPGYIGGSGSSVDLPAISYSLFIRLKKLGFDVEMVHALSLKRVFSGRGDAAKEQMVAEMSHRSHFFDLVGKIDDIADSFALSSFDRDRIESKTGTTN